MHIFLHATYKNVLSLIVGCEEGEPSTYFFLWRFAFSQRNRVTRQAVATKFLVKILMIELTKSLRFHRRSTRTTQKLYNCDFSAVLHNKISSALVP